jgi:hypothetical protein
MYNITKQWFPSENAWERFEVIVDDVEINVFADKINFGGIEFGIEGQDFGKPEVRTWKIADHFGGSKVVEYDIGFKEFFIKIDLENQQIRLVALNQSDKKLKIDSTQMSIISDNFQLQIGE